MGLLFAPHPQFKARVDTIGRDRAPVLVIDQFCADAEALVEAAESAFGRGRRDRASFPGIVFPGDQGFARGAVAHLMPLLCKVFGVSGRIQTGGFDFQLMTSSPDELSPRQKRPHIDVSDLNVVASVLFLCRPPYQGTAFYRHNDTGFEVISPDRARAYEAVQLALDARKSDSGYMNGDTADFTEIARYDAAFNRLILFSAASLHSGTATADQRFSADPRRGRLTANLFLRFAA